MIFGSVDKKKLNAQLLKRIAEDMITLTNEDVKLATLTIHGVAVKSIQDNADGETQRRYKPYRYVRVSSPGSTPNTDTGRLVQSIQFEFEETSGGFAGYVGTNLKYGVALEFGTSKMAARPWLRPAVKVGTEKFIKALVNKLKAQLKRESK